MDYERYYSRDFFDLEMKKLWPRVWQWACREEHILHVGDYVTYDVGPHSVILVRSAPGRDQGLRQRLPASRHAIPPFGQPRRRAGPALPVPRLDLEP